MKASGLVGPAMFAALLLVPACRKEEAAPAGPAPSAAAPSASASGVKVPRVEDLPEELRVPTAWPIPVGPRLEVVPGGGLGAIRLGATVETIERLMGTPCEMKGATFCRYPTRAVEFVLKDGATVEARAHRHERPASEDGQKYGIFNGRMRNGVALGMFPAAVKELLGAPLKVEPAQAGNPSATVEVYVYDGLRVEFDRVANGNVVVGGLVVVPGAGKRAPGAPAPSPAPAPKK